MGSSAAPVCNVMPSKLNLFYLELKHTKKHVTVHGSLHAFSDPY